MGEHFHVISRRFLRRRTLLKAAALGSAAVGLPVLGATGGRGRPGFAPLANALTADHEVAKGYRAQVLMRWGDELGGGAPPRFPLTAEEQRLRFGFNNDFIAYTPLGSSRRGLLSVNNEYPIPHLMFPGYRNEDAGKASRNAAHVSSCMAAVGHSVFEVARGRDGWAVVADSMYRRRIDASTPMVIDGPAAGDERLRTAGDPTGTRVLGTFGCCSGGKTPWGTVLIAEENVGDYFSGGDRDFAFSGGDRDFANALAENDPDDVYAGWAAVDPRFDTKRTPNELNRFGWIVEYDPRDPQSVPVKHTALGRFEHEGATVASEEGRPLVVYSGDDSENQFLYRYVSDAPYRAERGAGNSQLLAAGTLYCARLADDGTGTWLPLVFGQGPLVPANGFRSQAEVLVDARRAAHLLGATPMDRPEGIAISPVSGRVYAALTKNEEKTGVNGANPRRNNAAGQVLEIAPPRSAGAVAHWEETFSWDLLLQGGDPDAGGDAAGHYGGRPQRDAWLANPDNLAFDPAGRLWIATDGMNDFGFADGLWCTPVEGAARAEPALFYRCPRGAELCGPEFTPDGESLFVSVQHPAKEVGSTFERPSTRWPDFDAALPPRSAVVAITRESGGSIGD